MIKKRLVGVVTVKNGHAVQSFGYNRYLPLGCPEIMVENLNRWGADEILVQCIDRSKNKLGPDFGLLERIGKRGFATPLIYSGGIRSVEDAGTAVNLAADRVCVDALLHDNLEEVDQIGKLLGAQAVIAALPLSIEDGALIWRDYRTSETVMLDEVAKALEDGVISEAMVIDWKNEGNAGAFDKRLLNLGKDKNFPLIAFGGISDPADQIDLIQNQSVSAIAVGNFLAYREHAIQDYKKQLTGQPIRSASYQRELYS